MKYNYGQNKFQQLKITLIKQFILLLIGFIFGNYLLYSGSLNGLSTKITRLFYYEKIKNNIVKYEINYRGVK